jgi:hypothetical protein
MSNSMVMRLVLKDWHFQRWAIAGYLAAGGVALFLNTTAKILANVLIFMIRG